MNPIQFLGTWYELKSFEKGSADCVSARYTDAGNSTVMVENIGFALQRCGLLDIFLVYFLLLLLFCLIAFVSFSSFEFLTCLYIFVISRTVIFLSNSKRFIHLFINSSKWQLVLFVSVVLRWI